MADAPTTPDPVELERQWDSVCRSLGAGDDESIDRAWFVLDAMYHHPPRAYHNLDHIRACLRHFDPNDLPDTAIATSAETVRFAIFLHDCVYDSRRPDNEARSAGIAAMLARDMGLPAATIEAVRRLTMATTHKGEPADALEASIRDIDLASLAAEPSVFDANTRAIRQEYAWASDEKWRAGRAAFFRDMLARPRTYFTQVFHDRYEQAARANLERALKELER